MRRHLTIVDVRSDKNDNKTANWQTVVLGFELKYQINVLNVALIMFQVIN